MATFIGTEAEFNTYIGPRVRNKVQSITKPYKAAARNVCAHCHQQVSELEAAHVHGFERKEIIHQALTEKASISGEAYVVADLAAFEQTLVDAHLPIEEHFLFLCSKCHKEYDSVDEHARNRAECSQEQGRVKSAVKEKATVCSSGDMNRLKVGQIAKTRLRSVLQSGRVNEELAQKFTSKHYSNTIFNINFPLLMELQPGDDPSRAAKDANGIARFYVTPVRICGKRYLLSSQWYERSKDLLIHWIEQMER